MIAYEFMNALCSSYVWGGWMTCQGGQFYLKLTSDEPMLDLSFSKCWIVEIHLMLFLPDMLSLTTSSHKHNMKSDEIMKSV